MSAFDKIIGYSAEKKELKQIGDTLKNREVYEKLGVSSPRGLLLHGEPGVGKTLMAHALIEDSCRNVYSCRKDLPNGDFVKAIKTTFDEAAKNAPSIVLLDDMDKFANGDEIHRDAEEYVTVQSCIDEVKDKEVFVLATANKLHTLPDSLLRAGRFDRIMEVETPHGEDAVKITEHYLKSKKFAASIDARAIARIMDGRSCAVLATVINEAGLYAGYERAEEITMAHFMKACLRTVFDVSAVSSDGDEDWYTAFSDGENPFAQVVYHEAGHAVIAEVLSPESVTLVSVSDKNGVHSGFTSYYGSTAVSPIKRQQNRVISSLGGAAALEQKFGIVDPGATDDISQAFRMVQSLVRDYCSCGFHLYGRGYRDSEDMQARGEQAVASEVERYYKKAKEIIAQNSEFFEKIAKALAEKKLLGTEEIREIKKSCRIVPASV